MSKDTQNEMSPSNAEDPIKALASKLSDYAEDKERRGVVGDQVLQLLGKVDEDDRKALMKDPEFRKMIETLAEQERPVPKGRRPGEVFGEGFARQSVPWTWGDLAEFHPDGTLKTPYKEFTSPITEMVGWNGLMMSFEAWHTYRVPEVFYGELMQAVRSQRSAQEHAEYMMRKRDHVGDPTILTMASERVRASGDQGHYLPGGGNIADLNQAEAVKAEGAGA